MVGSLRRGATSLDELVPDAGADAQRQEVFQGFDGFLAPWRAAGDPVAEGVTPGAGIGRLAQGEQGLDAIALFGREHGQVNPAPAAQPCAAATESSQAAKAFDEQELHRMT